MYYGTAQHFDDVLDQRGTSSGVALAALEGARFTLKKTPGVLKNGSELQRSNRYYRGADLANGLTR